MQEIVRRYHPSCRCARNVLTRSVLAYLQDAIDLDNIAHRHLSVTVDHRNVPSSGGFQPGAHVPTHHALFSLGHHREARLVCGQCLQYRRRLIRPVVRQIVAHQDQLIVNLGFFQLPFHLGHQITHDISGMVAQDHDRQFRNFCLFAHSSPYLRHRRVMRSKSESGIQRPNRHTSPVVKG